MTTCNRVTTFRHNITRRIQHRDIDRIGYTTKAILTRYKAQGCSIADRKVSHKTHFIIGLIGLR